MAKFPSWMKMAKDPDSVGAKFLDVFGLTLEEVEEELNQITNNFYIESADVDMVDILYRVPLTSEVVPDFDSENIEIVIGHHNNTLERVNQVYRVRHLYQKEADLPVGLVNREDGFLYLRMDMDAIENREEPFEYIEVNNARHYSIDFHHVWNAFDEFGFLLGLNRLPLESNKEFKKRILDVFRNPGNSTRKGIIRGLSRELGINQEEMDVFELNESIYDKELVSPDGTPTKKMREYAKNINQNLKFTIDSLNLGEAYWETLEEENLGIHFLPHIWDIDGTLFDTEEFQSGVGYEDDLKVEKPKEGETTYRNFRLNVSLVGYYEDYEEFHPEISFEYKIYAQGKLLENTYEEETFNYTTVAAEVFEQDYEVIASQEFEYLHEILFDTPNDFLETEEMHYIHFGKSNEFLNDQTDNLQRISLFLATEHEYQSNQISDLKIDWLDREGGSHSYLIDSKDKWLNPQVNSAGQPTSTVVTFGTYYNTDGEGIELSRGDFNEKLETTTDFMRGYYETNFTIVKNGSVQLNIEGINQLMNDD